MCTNPDDFKRFEREKFNIDTLLARISRFKNGENEFFNNYKDAFSLGGGEPTLYHSLPLLIKKIDDFFPGIRITCLSNGRMFSYLNYAKQILQLDVNLELVIPIHGYNAKLHDRITMAPGSFRQTIEGINNICRLKKSKQLLEIRIVIHGLNYRFLRRITDFIKKEFPQIERLVYIFFEIEGQAVKNIVKIKTTYKQTRPYIEKIYNRLNFFQEVRFYHFPLCTIPPKFFPYIWRTLPSHEVAFPRICKKCNLKKLCLGVHKGYLRYVGSDEFRAVIDNDNFSIQEGNNWQHPIEKIKGIN